MFYPESIPSFAELIDSLDWVPLPPLPSAYVKETGSSYQGMSVYSVNLGLPGYVNGWVTEQSNFCPATPAGGYQVACSVSDTGSTQPDFDATDGQHSSPGELDQVKGIQPAAGKDDRLAASRSEVWSQCGKPALKNDYQRLYRLTPSGKAACVRYEQSPKGQQTKRLYQRSPKGKLARRAAQSRYAHSPHGKEKRRVAGAIRWVRACAYNKELARSHDETLARQKGEEAATRKKMELEQAHPLTHKHKTE